MHDIKRGDFISVDEEKRRVSLASGWKLFVRNKSYERSGPSICDFREVNSHAICEFLSPRTLQLPLVYQEAVVCCKQLLRSVDRNTYDSWCQHVTTEVNLWFSSSNFISSPAGLLCLKPLHFRRSLFSLHSINYRR
jgi:hypothetical protein